MCRMDVRSSSYLLGHQGQTYAANCRRRIPRPSDWGYAMTVCIGARDHGENVIMVTDHKVNVYEGQFTADETALKCKPLTSTWDVMYAGNDITLVSPIVKDAYDQLLATYG